MYNHHATDVVKQNNHLVLKCWYTEDDGSTFNLDGYSIKSQMKDATGTLLDELLVQPINMATGYFLLITTLKTLPVCTFYIDVLLTKDAEQMSSDIIRFVVERVVTDGNEDFEVTMIDEVAHA